MTSGPLIVVKRSEQEFHDFVSSPLGFMTIFGSYNEERLKFEGYQKAFLSATPRYRCIEKSRQTGYSFVFAAEAVARCHLRSKQTSIFVSYNLDDAKEKIQYARQLYEELPLEYQKKLESDSKTELAFKSTGPTKSISRILSNPSKAPRGKTGDIYLDELAHYRNDREVYKGSTALILRSKGQLTVCSSPLGRRGLFWEIARQEVRPYPGYWRQKVPWWLCGFYCKNVKDAAKHAPKMDTFDRIKAFADPNGGIMGIYESMALEDFQEEFEVIYQDETESFFSYDLIKSCEDPDLDVVDDPSLLDRFRGRLKAGYDVGRKKDRAELVVVEDCEDGKQRCRYFETHIRKPFQEQFGALATLLKVAPIHSLRIDATGQGAQLAEDLQTAFPDRVIPEDFTNAKKSLWAHDVKIGFQQRGLIIPADKAFVRQIHAIKKRVTPHGNIVFEVEASGNKSEIGHGDKFWALAMAAQRERGPHPLEPGIVGIKILG